MAVEWVRLELDLHAFDGAPYQQYLQRCRSAGIEFTTMEQLGDTVEQRRALFELNKLCSADIPERGTFSTWEVYEAERLNVAGYDPQGVMLALDQGRWAGMSATSLRRDKGDAFSEMTGVLRSHRRQGIALALKLLAVDFVQARGLRWLRTQHHPDNSGAIALNRRLGYTDSTA